MEINDGGIGRTREHVVPHPEDDTANAGEACLGPTDGRSDAHRLARLAPFDIFLQRRWFVAFFLREITPLDPPGETSPKRVVQRARRHRQTSGIMADYLRRTCAGRAHLGPEKRIVTLPIFSPFLWVGAGNLPRSVHIPVETLADILLIGQKPRPGGRRGHKTAARIFSFDKGVPAFHQRMIESDRFADARLGPVDLSLELVATAPHEQRSMMLPADDIGLRDGHENFDTRFILMRPVFVARRTERKFLPDEQAKLVAKIVKPFFFQDCAAPNAKDIAPELRVESDHLFIVLVLQVGEGRP